MGNSDSKRKLSRTEIEIVTNIFYLIIGIFLALGVASLVQFINIVYPPKNQTAYLLVFAVGLIAFACIFVFALLRFRTNHPLPDEG